ncbi:fatty acyl-CoA reductase wat-like [Vespula squamosa]|uniref:Fatty acyl-CoA reductase wat-like n=1 Tax=Vespula squamosa TaxID=30214 RepID=A0ABD2BH66_VESSQ
MLIFFYVYFVHLLPNLLIDTIALCVESKNLTSEHRELFFCDIKDLIRASYFQTYGVFLLVFLLHFTLLDTSSNETCYYQCSYYHYIGYSFQNTCNVRIFIQQDDLEKRLKLNFKEFNS